MADARSITAAGGVVFRQDKDQKEVLVIFRRGVWDLPKGKLEKGESIEQCAVREVAEEVGLSSNPQIYCPLPDTYHEYLQNGTKYGKTTHWFAMQLKHLPTNGFVPQQDEGIQEVRWMSLKEAQHSVGYDNLEQVLEAFATKDIL